MLILDTNIVSELMKERPEPAVLRWINEQRPTTLHLTAITVGEISFGIRILAPGKRRRFLEKGFTTILAVAFAGRVLHFDESAARWYGELMASRRGIGHPLSIADGQIAAIGRSQGYALATRNVSDFVECGLEIVNPFEAI